MNESRPPILRIRDLHKWYDDLHILRGLSCDLRAGEKVAIIGPSGSGKSTLLRLLMTLESPDSGEIEVDGQAMWSTTPAGRTVAAGEDVLRRIRAKLGMVFQHFHLFPHLTVLRNITAAPQIVKGIARDAAERRAGELLEMVGLADKANAYPAQLSGGQKQRVAIARALAMDPSVMLFDEVTSALDPELVGEVQDVLRQLAHQAAMTMLIVTHEMQFAREIADHVMFFDAGTIVEQGAPEQIFSAPKEDRTREFLQRVIDR